MADRVGGFRRKTRFKMRKNVSQRGKVSLRHFLQTFQQGEKVKLAAEPAYQKGMYFPRFYGRVGVVTKKVGSCYEITIDDLGKTKTVVVHPVHLRQA